MRKLFFPLAFLLAGYLAAGALIPQASAQIHLCDPKTTEASLRGTKSLCEDSCKGEKDRKGCAAVCDKDYKTCSDKVKQQKAEDDKAKKDADDKAKKAAVEQAAKKAADDRAAAARRADEEKAARKANDDKASAKPAKEYSFHEKMACRKPFVDCMQTCPDLGVTDTPCSQSCNQRFLAGYEACQKETGPLIDSKK
jgi:hypothetical protein